MRAWGVLQRRQATVEDCSRWRMKSFTYNPVVLHRQPSTSLCNQFQLLSSSLHRNNLEPTFIGRFRHDSVSRVFSSSRQLLRSHKSRSSSRTDVGCKTIPAGLGNYATISSLAPSFSNFGSTERKRGILQCRAGREPASIDDKVVEIGKEELDINVVRDGWQWTKTNQELVMSALCAELGFPVEHMAMPLDSICTAFDSNCVCLNADSIFASACSRANRDNSAAGRVSVVGCFLLSFSSSVDCLRRQSSQVWYLPTSL